VYVCSFTFGALISAVDPVATLAIFHALEVNPTLNMLVFGESVLNDAVAIVMTKTIMEQASSSLDNPGLIVAHAFWKFIVMFCGSALLGIVSALASALFLKYVNIREINSLEFVMWFIFGFGPYFIAEGLNLSGIMAVLFSGIVMSHYTHFNLSPVTQVTVQQTMRTVSFMAETVVFLYIGMQVFTITTSFSIGLIIWSLILILIGRAANIFPLSFLVNRFRAVQISPRMQFVMWFSGLRGAIAYALALNLQESVGDFASPETIRVLDTATLIIVLFTIVGLGASTLPLLTVCFFPKLH
jgi:sodium/hydrogen exchanger 8